MRLTLKYCMKYFHYFYLQSKSYLAYIFNVAPCAALSSPSNGSVTYSKPPTAEGSYVHDTVATFTCRHGYKRDGPSTSVAMLQENGNITHQHATKVLKSFF